MLLNELDNVLMLEMTAECIEDCMVDEYEYIDKMIGLDDGEDLESNQYYYEDDEEEF